MLLGDHENIQFKWLFWLRSEAGLSRIAPRLLVLAQFQEQILKCFLDRRLAFVMLHLRPSPPDFPFPPLFLSSFLNIFFKCIWGISIDVSKPGRDPRSFGEILCLGLDSLHLCSILRVLGEPSCQRKCNGCPFGVHQPGAALHTTRLPAFVTVYPSSHSASSHVGTP